LKDNFSTLKEYHIGQFSVELFVNGTWITVFMGDKIGSCKIIHLAESYDASKFRFNILQSKGIPSVYHIGIADGSKKEYRRILIDKGDLWLK
jgi:alpha-L-fucosidase